MSFSRAEVEAWLQQAWAFSEPRLVRSVGVLLAAVVLYFVLRWLLTFLQYRLAAKTKTQLDDLVVRLLRRALLMSVVFGVLWRVALVWDQEVTGRVISALWVVALSFPFSRFIRDLLEIFEKTVVARTETKLDDTVLPLANRMIQLLVIGVGILSGMLVMDWEITPLLGVGGVAGLALSFAAKDALSNLIAGFLLILDQPFQVGDRIEIWGAPKNTATWGDVVQIGLRATKIKTTDNLIVIIPNAEIMQRDIINYTASGDHIRLRVPIGIGYDADVEKAKELVRQVAESIEGVMEKPAPVVIIRRFGDSGVDLEARVWVRDARQRRNVEDELTDGIKTAFDANGIEIPFPKHDIYVKNLPAETAASLGSGSILKE